MESVPVDPIARFAGSLSGRAVVVSGAGSGIGRAITIAFARAGADVGLLGRRADLLEETAALVRDGGRRALTVPVDVSDAGAVERSIAQVTSSVGAPDVAVAAAGVNAWAELSELTPELLGAALRTNVEGVANLARAVVPAMRDRAAGKLIVIASDNGRRAEGGGSGYVASKFGAVGLALSLSQELYASGVGVHVIEPGCVDTPWYPRDEEAPRDRMLRAEDVALVALFLATLPNAIVLEEVMLLPRGLLVEPWS